MAATHHRPLHALLGGGAVADLLLWRRRNTSAAAVAGATLFWFLFERAVYSLASVLSNAVLLLVDILFFWAKSASLLNRSTRVSTSEDIELIHHSMFFWVV
uniref:Reticulon-like protein n=1 Tax=Aegilops tauschii subsp. strangulata TaxID=200361 RepID=A0A453D247_AEGTS